MKSHEPFIEPESTYYVYSPSLLGRSMFFYPLTCGHFFYAPGYHLHRASFDSFLLIYVKKGSMYVQTKDESFDAKADEFILINCYDRTAMAQKQAVNVSGAILTDLLPKTFLNLLSHILALYFLLEILRQPQTSLKLSLTVFVVLRLRKLFFLNILMIF